MEQGRHKPAAGHGEALGSLQMPPGKTGTYAATAETRGTGTATELPGLYDQRFEHDSCGIGAVVNMKGIKTHKTVEQALHIVENLEHRAGKDGERVPVYHNLNAPEKQNIIMHIFYKRKAKLYAWALAKGQNTWSGIPPERFMKIGKYIYQYPASSVFFRMIVRLRNAWRKR